MKTLGKMWGTLYNMNKKIAVFGHRKIDEKDKHIVKDINNILKNFVINNDTTFLFGSNSEFNDTCYNIITKLKDIYNNIKRIGYLCAAEIAFTKDEAINYQKYIDKSIENGKQIKIYDQIQQLDFDGKNLYIERNKKMIDNADICIFYYNNKNVKPTNKLGNKTNSGTKIALEYAKSKCKDIIILN